MDILEFKEDIERRIGVYSQFELQEVNYRAYCFGNGVLAYRIRGYCFQFIYDGKEDQLIILQSNRHEKYPRCHWTQILKKDGLSFDDIDIQMLLEGMTK
jgi:hypothetical protein